MIIRLICFLVHAIALFQSGCHACSSRMNTQKMADVILDAIANMGSFDNDSSNTVGLLSVYEE